MTSPTTTPTPTNSPGPQATTDKSPIPNPKSPILPSPSPGTHTETPWLDPARLRLARSPRGQLTATLDDRVCHLRVTARRLRPLTQPSRFIALWAADTEEVGVLETLDTLDTDSAALLDQELQRRYFMPAIRRVLRVRTRSDVHEWSVETDHGQLTFFVRGLHQNIRQVGPVRLLITDVRGNRYDIPDVNALDARSFALIQRHL